MSRLTRVGTAEPVSRDQILRHARVQENITFPCSADHEQDWQPYAVDPHSAICDDHTYLPKGTKLELGREAPLVNTIILNQPYRRCISTDRLNREDTLLAASIEGEPGPTTAGKTFPHSSVSCPLPPKPDFGV